MPLLLGSWDDLKVPAHGRHSTNVNSLSLSSSAISPRYFFPTGFVQLQVQQNTGLVVLFILSLLYREIMSSWQKLSIGGNEYCNLVAAD